jgi:O-antigen/teichoic acid export membrane protein
MSKLKRNIGANLSGNIWTGLMGLVFVPLYIKFLGIEAYGLIGVFVSLLAIFGLLDMGLSSTLNREIARSAVQEGNAQEMRDLVRTLEIPYWLIGLLISAIVFVLSPFIACNWVNAKNLSPQTVQTAIMLMGLAVTFQWPISFYSGGLMGLQRQVLLNVINVSMATFRGVGAVLVLWLVSSSVEAYFYWQIVVSVIHVGLIVYYLWSNLPYVSETPRFRRELLLKIWRYAAGITGITITGVLITQIDKILLSKLLTLESFGYYSFSIVVGSILSRFVEPIFSAVFPRLAELVSLQDEMGIKELYHKSCQLLAVIVLPVAIVLIFFSSEILLLWTGDIVTVHRTHLIVSLCAIGGLLNALMYIPYALTLAYGWTTITFYMHIVAIIVLGPMIYFLTITYGIIGAPIGWIVYNIMQLIVWINIMHSRLLKKEKLRWYIKDVGIPLVVALVIASFWRLNIPIGISRITILPYLTVVFLTTLWTTAVVTSSTRPWVIHIFKIKTVVMKFKAFYGGKSSGK